MDITPEKLMDLGLEIGLVPDAKYHYRWNQLSKWQFEAILKIGLQKDSYLLDVGCGALRFGARAINYLDSGHYFGIDAIEQFLVLGNIIANHLEVKKEYNTIHSNRFEFEKFNQKFDFAIAQSVFTHLNYVQIEECIHNLTKVMLSSGKFLFTYTNKSKPYGFLYNDYEPVIAGVGINEDFIKYLEQKFQVKISTPEIPHPFQRVGLMEF